MLSIMICYIWIIIILMDNVIYGSQRVLIINDCFREVDVIDVIKLMWDYMDNVIWIIDIIDMIHE